MAGLRANTNRRDRRSGPARLASLGHRAQRLVAERRTACDNRGVTSVIAQRELRNQNAAVVAAVVAGETFLVTRNGTPVAELRPITQPSRTFVARATLAALAAQGPHLDAAAFRDDADRAIDQEL